MKTVFIILTALLLTGCSFFKTIPPGGICETAPEDSILCELFPNIEAVGNLLIIADIEAIEDGLLNKKQVINALERAESALNKYGTYKSYAIFLESLIANSAGLGKISEHLAKLIEKTDKITDFDIGLLKAYFQGLRERISQL